MQVPSYSPRRSRLARAAVWTLILTLAMPGGLVLPRPAAAANAIQTILSDALYGGAAGLLLGGVLMLVVDKDSRDDTLRWGAVIGTFAGFAYGVYDTQKGSGDYSELFGRPATPEGAGLWPGTRDPRWEQTANALGLQPYSGSPLAAAACPAPSARAVRETARGAYGRGSW